MSRGRVRENTGAFLTCPATWCEERELTRRYIISVITITSIGEGKILPSTGQARFRTTYTAIVMKPFKGEVVDAKVVNVNKVSGIHL